MWLGGDSEDRIGNSFFPPAYDTLLPFELVVQNKKTSGADGQTGTSDQNVSQTDGVQDSSNSANLALQTAAAPTSNILDGGFSIFPVHQLGHNPLGILEPIDALPVAEPLIGSPDASPGPLSPSPLFWVAPQPTGGVATPEPSTWVMMLAGFACLGFAGYRTSRKRIALVE